MGLNTNTGDISTVLIIQWMAGAAFTLLILLANIQLGQINTRLDRLEQNNVAETTKVAVMENTITGLNVKLGTLDGQASALYSRLGVMEANLGTLTIRVAQLEKKP